MPLKCLRPGYRHVRLRDITNVPLELATLFIYSKITETILIRNPDQDLSSSNTPYLFRNRILRRNADPQDLVAVCHNMFFSFANIIIYSYQNRQVVNLFDLSIKHLKLKSTVKMDVMKTFDRLL
jgi:hypothetical protein